MEAYFSLGLSLIASGKYAEAAEMFERLSVADRFEEFLTLPAYELID